MPLANPTVGGRARIAPTATNGIPANQFLKPGRIMYLYPGFVDLLLDDGKCWAVLHKDLLPEFNLGTKTLNETLSCLSK